MIPSIVVCAAKWCSFRNRHYTNKWPFSSIEWICVHNNNLDLLLQKLVFIWSFVLLVKRPLLLLFLSLSLCDAFAIAKRCQHCECEHYNNLAHYCKQNCICVWAGIIFIVFFALIIDHWSLSIEHSTETVNLPCYFKANYRCNLQAMHQCYAICNEQIHSESDRYYKLQRSATTD